MSEIFKGREQERVQEGDPYADIPGVPYPVLPLHARESVPWIEGQKKIFARMREEEKNACTNLKERLERAPNEQAFYALLEELKTVAKSIGGPTVHVRNIEVLSPSGALCEIAVIFKPRREISQKDEPLVFGVMVL